MENSSLHESKLEEINPTVRVSISYLQNRNYIFLADTDKIDL